MLPRPDLIDVLGEPLAAAVLFGFGLLVAAVPWTAAGGIERLLARRGRIGLGVGLGLVIRGVGLLLALLAALAAADALGYQRWEDVDWARVAAMGLFLFLGSVLVRQTAGAIERSLASTGKRHLSLLVGKGVRYVGLAVVVLVVAQAFGFDLTAVLATAGVLGVAVGFAAQTSLSNVIAGVFLLVDRPFEIGDVVEITGQQGVVQAITLLSTRVRTFENLVVRWPNEVVLKERIVNYAQMPARRLELRVRVPLGSPLDDVRRRLLAALAEQPTLLLEPAPEVRFKDLEDNGVTVMVRAWARVDGWLAARDAFVVGVHDALLASGVVPRVPTYHAAVEPGAGGEAARAAASG
jgi:small-conductance mechanosensitive channel